jgi:ADP-heptose:LPS heptosyltransferase
MLVLAQTLRDNLGWDMAVTASEEDAFLRDHPDWTRLIAGPRTQLLENRPFEELCETLGAARLFVGNDSGIGHLAANLGIPSAVLFVSTDPVQWAPWVPEDRLRVIDLRNSELSAGVLRQEAERLLKWADGTC